MCSWHWRSSGGRRMNEVLPIVNVELWVRNQVHQNLRSVFNRRHPFSPR
ncbi:MAG: hypothetical protein HZA46_22455 [Planctomycetales bacterium]|nr:hypothetical protein [Planctomycetales bacterium]